MRYLVLVGKVYRNNRLPKRLARFCAWGNHWMSVLDERLHHAGAQTTHGMCDECAKRWLDFGPDSAA